VIRGIESIEKPVTRRSASARATSASTSGWRNATSTLSARKRESSSGEGFCSFTTTSASAYSSSGLAAIRAPAFS
jgi:hypothetical protein